MLQSPRRLGATSSEAIWGAATFRRASRGSPARSPAAARHSRRRDFATIPRPDGFPTSREALPAARRLETVVSRAPARTSPDSSAAGRRGVHRIATSSASIPALSSSIEGRCPFSSFWRAGCAPSWFHAAIVRGTASASNPLPTRRVPNPAARSAALPVSSTRKSLDGDTRRRLRHPTSSRPRSGGNQLV